MSDLLSNPSRGRHRALSAEDQTALRRAALAEVPADVRAALERAVVEAALPFEADEWEFEREFFLGWVARRRNDDTSNDGHQTLGVTADCRSVWVPSGQDPKGPLGALERSGQVPRSQIEFLLLEENRFYKGSWFVVPVFDLGWVCTRAARFGRQSHFVVSRDRAVVKVETPDVALARVTLSVMLSASAGSSEAGFEDTARHA